MKEIHKVKFAIFYAGKIISAIYLAYYLISVVASLFIGLGFAVLISIDISAVVLFACFHYLSKKELENYLKQ